MEWAGYSCIRITPLDGLPVLWRWEWNMGPNNLFVVAGAAAGVVASALGIVSKILSSVLRRRAG